MAKIMTDVVKIGKFIIGKKVVNTAVVTYRGKDRQIWIVSDDQFDYLVGFGNGEPVELARFPRNSDWEGILTIAKGWGSLD